MANKAGPEPVDSALFDLFRAEVETHTQALSEGLLALEPDAAQPRRVEAIMRAAHSIKGAARIVGVEAGVQVAHAMEDYLVAAQRGQVTLTSAAIDVLLRGVDALTRIAQPGGAAPAGPALDALVESRRTEGRALREDFRARMNAVETHRRRVEELAPQREERERDRLREKVRALLDEQADADARIEAEIVLLADRVDVSEELTRLRAHLDHFAAELESGAGSVGRKLTFILQELGREANTIGSKASDPEIQKSAIEIKAELEKMREQAENVE